MYNINDIRVISNLFSTYLTQNRIESKLINNILESNNNTENKNNKTDIPKNITQKNMTIPLDEKIIGEIYYPVDYSEINESGIKKKMVLFNINTWHIKHYIYKEIPWDYEGKELKKEDVFGIYRGNGDLDVYLRINTPF